jgi:CRP-like cAMP-binding protein
MDKVNTTCVLCESKTCFIKKLSPEWLSWVDSKKHTVLFPIAHSIFYENTEVKDAHFIKKGKVKIFSSGKNKKKKIIRLAGDGHIIGYRDEVPEKSPVSATTLEESLVCIINNVSLYELSITNPLFSYCMTLFYSRELKKAEQRAKYNSQMKSKERIICALLYAKETFGYSDENPRMLNVHLTRPEIASLADTTAEGVSRALTILEEEEIIRRTGKNIQILNEDKLLDMIEEYGIYRTGK